MRQALEEIEEENEREEEGILSNKNIGEVERELVVDFDILYRIERLDGVLREYSQKE